MGVLLGLLAAFCYGTSDFAGGVGGRRGDPTAVAVIGQPFGMVAAIIAIIVVRGGAPNTAAIVWGALAGLGNGIGTIALYRGLATGRIGLVAPLSALISAALPALVGLMQGEHLSISGWVGLLAALPAIVLISSGHDRSPGGSQAAVIAAVVAGTGFALLFIGLGRAGTRAGAWPLLPCDAVDLVFVLGVAMIGQSRSRALVWAKSWTWGALAGVLGGLASLTYLAATGDGALAIIAVVTSLYPAVTVVLARVVLRERWSPPQLAGMLIAAGAVGLIAAS